MRCVECGSPVEGSPNFCPHCGARMPLIPMAESAFEAREPAHFEVTEKEIILDPIPESVVREDTGISSQVFEPQPTPARHPKKGFWDLIGWVLEQFVKGYFDFKGRASRFEFWPALAIAWLLMRTASFFDADLITLAVFIPTLSCMIRRLRDAGYNPYWGFLLLVPPPGWIALLVMLCTRSKD